MKYIIKNIEGTWWACIQTLNEDALYYVERHNPRKRLVGGTIVTEARREWRKAYYKSVHHRYDDGTVKDCLMSRNGTTEIGNLFLAQPKDLYVPKINLPQDADLVDGACCTAEEVDRIVNPYPAIVLQLATLLQQQGECWKDDCGVLHVDDIDTFATAEKIYTLLKTNDIDFVTETFVPKHENVTPLQKEEQTEFLEPGHSTADSPAVEALDGEESIPVAKEKGPKPGKQSGTAAAALGTLVHERFFDDADSPFQLFD